MLHSVMTIFNSNVLDHRSHSVLNSVLAVAVEGQRFPGWKQMSSGRAGGAGAEDEELLGIVSIVGR